MEEKNFKSIEEVQAEIQVSQNCKLCRPYINKMIETGETEFTCIITE